MNERVRGLKVYELSNHLGNVLTTISDYKRGIETWVTSEQDGKADFYAASVKSASDYYPFGLQMQGRQNNVNAYRYGFNGKENDGDFQQSDQGQLIQDYGFRIYNPSIAKFLSVDPLTKSYPMLTPYQFASNRPIDGIDIDGLEWGRADPNASLGLSLLKLKLEKDNDLDAIRAIDAANSDFRRGVALGGLSLTWGTGLTYLEPFIIRGLVWGSNPQGCRIKKILIRFALPHRIKNKPFSLP